jgi:branched-chain amino acid transport system permease protein
LGLQLNVGFTGLINLGQAGLMAIGAYAMGMLVVDAGWPLLFALPGAILVSIAAGALIGLPTSRLRAAYFGIVTIAFSEIIRYTLQNAAFAGGNQGVLGYDRDFEAWALSKLAPFGLGGTTQLPRLIAVWTTLLICLAALKVLQRSPWGVS